MSTAIEREVVAEYQPVLPPGYLASISDLALCPCQWGPSGYCSGGDHDQCPRTRGLERRDPQPETYIVSRRHWAALTPVWRAGGACRWLCSCSCHLTKLEVVEQLGLFEVSA